MLIKLFSLIRQHYFTTFVDRKNNLKREINNYLNRFSYITRENYHCYCYDSGIETLIRITRDYDEKHTTFCNDDEMQIKLRDYPYMSFVYKVHNCVIHVRNNLLLVYNNVNTNVPKYSLNSDFSTELEDISTEDYFSIGLMISSDFDVDTLKDIVNLYKEFKKENFKYQVTIENKLQFKGN